MTKREKLKRLKLINQVAIDLAKTMREIAKEEWGKAGGRRKDFRIGPIYLQHRGKVEKFGG